MAKARRRTRVKTPPLLIAKTQSLLKKIQPKVDGVLVTYWTSTSGSVCDNDVLALQELLQDLGPQRQITLVVKSDGGSGMAALRMVHLLRQYTRRLTLLAPLNCASAATMLALGADRIGMGPLSYLTAVDTSLEHDLSPVDHTNNLVAVSNDEVERVIRLWKESAGRRHRCQPLPGAVQVPSPAGHRRPRPREQPLADALPRDPRLPHEDKKKADRISRQLNSSYPAHQYPITSREARRLGLDVFDIDPELDELLQDLNLSTPRWASARSPTTTS
jgi:hypothetical protein